MKKILEEPKILVAGWLETMDNIPDKVRDNITKHKEKALTKLTREIIKKYGYNWEHIAIMQKHDLTPTPFWIGEDETSELAGFYTSHCLVAYVKGVKEVEK